ncbi:MAG: queuosine precursor transporter [Pseudomonadota bacterium]|nr:queuosine precursor transporter [Pseudomonadota bacterium]
MTAKRDLVFLFLAGLFISNAILAEIIGGKLIQVGPYLMSVGVILWPVVFLTTDMVNEYFGKSGVRRLTWLTVGLIVYAFIVLYFAMWTKAAGVSPVNDDQFNAVFGQSLWIIVGSIVAFLVSQFVDVTVFWFFRQKTGSGRLWLRATGSTAISQLVDTFIVLGIAFYLSGKLTLEDYLRLSFINYSYKLLIALALTPVIYGFHHAIDRYLAKE